MVLIKICPKICHCYGYDGTDVGYLQALNNVVLLEAKTLTRGLMESLKATKSFVHLETNREALLSGGAPSAVNVNSHLGEVQVR